MFFNFPSPCGKVCFFPARNDPLSQGGAWWATLAWSEFRGRPHVFNAHRRIAATTCDLALTFYEGVSSSSTGLRRKEHAAARRLYEQTCDGASVAETLFNDTIKDTLRELRRPWPGSSRARSAVWLGSGNLIGLLLTTDDVVNVRTAARRWNVVTDMGHLETPSFGC